MTFSSAPLRRVQFGPGKPGL